MEFDRYTVVISRSGPRADEFSEDELDRLQAAHITHLNAMRERGAMLAGGPFDDQEDESFRGNGIYRTGLDETRELVALDPSMQAGRMRAEIVTWLTPRGELRFPRAEERQLSISAGPDRRRAKEPGRPMEFDTYSLVLLRRGDRAFDYPEEDIDRLQAAHLAHLDAMRGRGALLSAGPFREQEDETFRGICLYRTGQDETRELCALDPSVQAGRMRADVVTWLTPRGELAFPGSDDEHKEDA
jgi:uncharacterized protein YciI